MINLLDLVLISIFTISTLIGGIRGAIISIINIFLGCAIIIIAILIEPLSNDVIKEYISIPVVSGVLSSALSYFLSSIIISFIASQIRQGVSNYTKGFLDKLIGLLVGSLRGIAICFLIFVSLGAASSGSYIGAKSLWDVFAKIDPQQYPKWLKKGYLFHPLQDSLVYAIECSEDSMFANYLSTINLPSPSGSGAEIEDSQMKQEESTDHNINSSNIIDQVQKQLLPELEKSVMH